MRRWNGQLRCSLHVVFWKVDLIQGSPLVNIPQIVRFLEWERLSWCCERAILLCPSRDDCAVATLGRIAVKDTNE